jgi:preprotein translocase SecE subunit
MGTTDRERLNVANKMADKKKNASQEKMVAPAPVARGGEKEKQQSKTVKAVTRERDERKERESKSSGRTESKQSLSTRQRFRNNRLVRFVREAYHELRYKVTWPTFEEARNMTLVVIGLSAAVGIVLWVTDLGLFQLFQLINK